jgi:SET domain-containing protein
MRNPKLLTILFFTAIFLSSIGVPLYAQKSAQEIALVQINKKYETRTVVKKSTIPNAGNGLFAVLKIKEGEVIGELGGRLVSDKDYPEGNHYIAAIPECAWEKTHPYKHIDSKDYGGNVSRINFAPREINGIETNLQNAAIKQLCEDPYFIFVALKDIEAGAEIWSSYGPYYEYDKFMLVPEVRDFFCGLIKMDCSEEFNYSH